MSTDADRANDRATDRANGRAAGPVAEPAWLQRMPEPQRRRMLAGSHHADPRRIGASIAIGGGLVFCFSYGADAIAEPWSIVVRALAVALAALTVWRLFFAPLPLGAPATPRRGAWLAYLGSVAAMLAAIAAGRALLVGLGAEHASGSWIAVCVGLHFIPFAWAFRERMLARLALVVAGAGVAGLALALSLGEPWGELGAVAAGLAQLAVLALWAFRRR